MAGLPSTASSLPPGATPSLLTLPEKAPTYQPGQVPPPYPGYSDRTQLPLHAMAQPNSSKGIQDNALPLSALSTQSPLPDSSSAPRRTFDMTGQIAPPGMKSRVTITCWEDEGPLCFQVEAKGVYVARREGKQDHINSSIQKAY